MLRVNEVIGPGERGTGAPSGTVTLTFHDRRRSRLLAALDDGRELALMLPRGSVLRDGDRLRASDGAVVTVRAADESLSVARAPDPRLLARAAYHLGNRHVPVQVGDGLLAYLHDHVLDDMVRGLGLSVEARVAPFEPEAGAFHGGAHHHDTDPDHDDHHHDDHDHHDPGHGGTHHH
ncbi:MAG TPA: urease accessory protein UreE [Polyangia bacterium]|nr:urease accessory protein UreE [Polyangia bacterium]